MIPRVYIDTSVVGGCLDKEFSRWSEKLFDEFRSGIKIAVVSDLTLHELEDAPVEVREILSDLPSDSVDHVFLTKEAIELATSYIEHGIVAEKHLLDAQHIAIATIAMC